MDDVPDWGDEEKGAGFLGPRGTASTHREVKEEEGSGLMGPRGSAAEPMKVKEEVGTDELHRPPATWPSAPALQHMDCMYVASFVSRLT
jgi:hypothetical protein